MPIFPLAGMPRATGVEEQIVQSAQTGIYPAITPAVRVFDVADQPNRMIVVVKVPESIEAPHAIENSTRVYIRVASTTSPYDLANIDRIEYLLKRRQEPERRREELIAQAAERSFFRRDTPRIRVVIAPVYPRGVLVPLDTLYERAQRLAGAQRGRYLEALRRIHGAIMSSAHTRSGLNYHFEVSSQGVAFFESLLEYTSNVVEGRDLKYVFPWDLLGHPATVLNHALPLLQGAVTNVLIRYELFRWNGIGFLPRFRPECLIDWQDAVEHYQCVDSHVAVTVYSTLETLPERRIEVLTDLMQQVLWAFDYTNENLENLVSFTLKQTRLA